MKKSKILFLCLLLFFISQHTNGQSGFVSVGYNISSISGSNSYSIGQFAYKTYQNGNQKASEGLQFSWEELTITTVPNNLNVINQSILSSNSECFNAEVDITVSGDGNNVIIENNAFAEFIAGNSIQFLPGFHAMQGSTVSAHITTDRTFCESYPAPIVEIPVVEKSIIVESDEICSKKDIKVYPNPNNGQFNIESQNLEKNTTILIYNHNGKLCYYQTLNSTTIATINLQNYSAGIYFVNAQNADNSFVKKIIVR